MSLKNINLRWLTLLCLLGLWCWDTYLLYLYAFDLPYHDGWEMMPYGNFKHIFRFQNENLHLMYAIVSELMYKFFDWNLRYFSFVNFFFYTLCVYTYYKIINKTTNITYFPLFLLPLLVPLLGYNWLWAFLVQTHTYILFFLLSIWFGFIKDKLFLFIMCIILSVLSMNFPLGLGAVIAYIVKEFINMNPENKPQKIYKILILLASMGIFCCIMWCMHKDLPADFKRTYNPFTLIFIEQLSFYVMQGFFIFVFGEYHENGNILLFAIWCAFMLITFLEQYKEKRLQPLWGIIFSVLLNVCGVVLLRHGEVFQYNLTFIRHNEVLFMLIPASFAVLFSSKRKITRIYSTFLLLLMLFGVTNDIKENRFKFFSDLLYKNACVCYNHYYNLKTIDEKEWPCTMNYYRPDYWLEYAKNMHLSFYETIKSCY